MICIQDKGYCPNLEEIGEAVGNPVFLKFCTEVMERYQCRETIEYSSCSLEPGWNVKFKKSGRNLCTIYPKENFFRVMVVIGGKEREAAEAVLQELTPALRELYRTTRLFNGQRWLVAELEDKDGMYEDIFRLLDIRRGKPPAIDRKQG